MNTTRTVLIACLLTSLAMLAACGGGGDEEPEPVLIYTAEASASGGPTAAEGLRSNYSFGITGPRLTLDRPALLEVCADVTYAQAVTAPVVLRVELLLGSPTGDGSSGTVREVTIPAAGVTPTTIRRCRTAEAQAGQRDVALTLRSSSGVQALGDYTAAARWTIHATYR